MSELIEKRDDSDSDDDVPALSSSKEAAPVVEIDDKLSNSDVVTKYQEAAKIAQAALLHVISLVKSFGRLDQCLLNL